MDKWMVLTYWNFDIKKELTEFKASSVVARWAVTEQEYGMAELVGGEVSAVGAVNALSSVQVHSDPFCYFSVSPFWASVCFASKSSHLCLYSEDWLWHIWALTPNRQNAENAGELTSLGSALSQWLMCGYMKAQLPCS